MKHVEIEEIKTLEDVVQKLRELENLLKDHSKGIRALGSAINDHADQLDEIRRELDGDGEMME